MTPVPWAPFGFRVPQDVIPSLGRIRSLDCNDCDGEVSSARIRFIIHFIARERDSFSPGAGPIGANRKTNSVARFWRVPRYRITRGTPFCQTGPALRLFGVRMSFEPAPLLNLFVRKRASGAAQKM